MSTRKFSKWNLKKISFSQGIVVFLVSKAANLRQDPTLPDEYPILINKFGLLSIQINKFKTGLENAQKSTHWTPVSGI